MEIADRAFSEKRKWLNINNSCELTVRLSLLLDVTLKMPAVASGDELTSTNVTHRRRRQTKRTNKQAKRNFLKVFSL